MIEENPASAVESNVCRIVACWRGYQVVIKPGHDRQELPGEFACIEASMRRAGIVNHALFAAMYQMAGAMKQENGCASMTEPARKEVMPNAVSKNRY